MSMGESGRCKASFGPKGVDWATKAVAAVVAVSLVMSGCSIPLGVRNVQVGTKEEKKVLDTKVHADLRIEGGSIAVVRVSAEQRTQIDILAVYHRMVVSKDLTWLVLGSVGVCATLFTLLLVAAANSDSDGGGGGGWDD